MRQDNNNTKSQNKEIINWHSYGLALGKRGSFITLVDMAEKRGAFKTPLHTHNPGRPRKYSDELIILVLIFHELYRQPLRQVITFTWEILISLGKYASMPDYSTISRRASDLHIDILPDDYCLYADEGIDFLVDSSGFYAHGEGNWYRRKHGLHAHRQWQETHVGIDYKSRMILAVIDTPCHVHDNTQLLPLIISAELTLRRVNIVQRLNSIIGDGAYDAKDNYKLAEQFNTIFIAPPQKNAKLHYDVICDEQCGYNRHNRHNRHGGHNRHNELYDKHDGYDKHSECNELLDKLVDTPGWEARNAVIQDIQRCGGMDKWKEKVGYHKRSLIENTFYRFKTIFGDKMSFRSEKNRHIEQLIRARILNLFTSYGLPRYGNQVGIDENSKASKSNKTKRPTKK